MPELSIVTPCFNQARFVRAALDSVAALPVDHEHILFDGGSTDGTVDILRERDDPVLRWKSEPDRGQTHAVNKGLREASGEFIGWLNADDEYMPDAVGRAIDKLRADPGLTAVYGGIDVIDDEGTSQRVYIPPAYSWRRLVFVGDYIPTPTIFFRRGLLDEVGYLDETLQDGADYEFYLRVFHGRRVERLPQPVVRFRFHEGSKSHDNVWLQQDEMLQARLRWARHPADRAIMRGVDGLKRAILPRVSHWPRYIPEEGKGDSVLISTADRIRRRAQ